MRKIKLYDYQQVMLENIISVLTTAAIGRFYDENGKKVKVGSSVMVQMPTGTGKTYAVTRQVPADGGAGAAHQQGEQGQGVHDNRQRGC